MHYSIFFSTTATTEIYTLSLHDALPICRPAQTASFNASGMVAAVVLPNRSMLITTTRPVRQQDRKSTRLNSSHTVISYAVFCLKKKKITTRTVRDVRLNSNHCIFQHTPT